MGFARTGDPPASKLHGWAMIKHLEVAIKKAEPHGLQYEPKGTRVTWRRVPGPGARG